VHVAPACVGSGEGSDHFGSYVHNLSPHFHKRLFPGLEPITSWSQDNNFTTALGLPFIFYTMPGYMVSPVLYICCLGGVLIFCWIQEVPEGTKKSPGGPWHFVGLMPLFDPPRHDSAETIRRALNLGVNVKMITGMLPTEHIQLLFCLSPGSLIFFF
jgi:hypothetical protein